MSINPNDPNNIINSATVLPTPEAVAADRQRAEQEAAEKAALMQQYESAVAPLAPLMTGNYTRQGAYNRAAESAVIREYGSDLTSDPRNYRITETLPTASFGGGAAAASGIAEYINGFQDAREQGALGRAYDAFISGTEGAATTANVAALPAAPLAQEGYAQYNAAEQTQAINELLLSSLFGSKEGEKAARQRFQSIMAKTPEYNQAAKDAGTRVASNIGAGISDALYEYGQFAHTDTYNRRLQAQNARFEAINKLSDAQVKEDIANGVSPFIANLRNVGRTFQASFNEFANPYDALMQGSNALGQVTAQGFQLRGLGALGRRLTGSAKPQEIAIARKIEEMSAAGGKTPKTVPVSRQTSLEDLVKNKTITRNEINNAVKALRKDAEKEGYFKSQFLSKDAAKEAALIGGTEGAGSIGQAQRLLDNMSDEQLLKQSPTFAQYFEEAVRQGYSAAEALKIARERLISDMALREYINLPMAIAAANLTHAPGNLLARKITAKPLTMTGILGNTLGEATEEVTTAFTGEGAANWAESLFEPERVISSNMGRAGAQGFIGAGLGTGALGLIRGNVYTAAHALAYPFAKAQEAKVKKAVEKTKKDINTAVTNNSANNPESALGAMNKYTGGTQGTGAAANSASASAGSSSTATSSDVVQKLSDGGFTFTQNTKNSDGTTTATRYTVDKDNKITDIEQTTYDSSGKPVPNSDGSTSRKVNADQIGNPYQGPKPNAAGVTTLDENGNVVNNTSSGSNGTNQQPNQQTQPTYKDDPTKGEYDPAVRDVSPVAQGEKGKVQIIDRNTSLDKVTEMAYQNTDVDYIHNYDDGSVSYIQSVKEADGSTTITNTIVGPDGKITRKYSQNYSQDFDFGVEPSGLPKSLPPLPTEDTTATGQNYTGRTLQNVLDAAKASPAPTPQGGANYTNEEEFKAWVQGGRSVAEINNSNGPTFDLQDLSLLDDTVKDADGLTEADRYAINRPDNVFGNDQEQVKSTLKAYDGYKSWALTSGQEKLNAISKKVQNKEQLTEEEVKDLEAAAAAGLQILQLTSGMRKRYNQVRHLKNRADVAAYQKWFESDQGMKIIIQTAQMAVSLIATNKENIKDSPLAREKVMVMLEYGQLPADLLNDIIEDVETLSTFTAEQQAQLKKYQKVLRTIITVESGQTKEQAENKAKLEDQAGSIKFEPDQQQMFSTSTTEEGRPARLEATVIPLNFFRFNKPDSGHYSLEYLALQAAAAIVNNDVVELQFVLDKLHSMYVSKTNKVHALQEAVQDQVDIPFEYISVNPLTQEEYVTTVFPGSPEMMNNVVSEQRGVAKVITNLKNTLTRDNPALAQAVSNNAVFTEGVIAESPFLAEELVYLKNILGAVIQQAKEAFKAEGKEFTDRDEKAVIANYKKQKSKNVRTLEMRGIEPPPGYKPTNEKQGNKNQGGSSPDNGGLDDDGGNPAQPKPTKVQQVLDIIHARVNKVITKAENRSFNISDSKGSPGRNLALTLNVNTKVKKANADGYIYMKYDGKTYKAKTAAGLIELVRRGYNQEGNFNKSTSKVISSLQDKTGEDLNKYIAKLKKPSNITDEEWNKVAIEVTFQAARNKFNNDATARHSLSNLRGRTLLWSTRSSKGVVTENPSNLLADGVTYTDILTVLSELYSLNGDQILKNMTFEEALEQVIAAQNASSPGSAASETDIDVDHVLKEAAATKVEVYKEGNSVIATTQDAALAYQEEEARKNAKYRARKDLDLDAKLKRVNQILSDLTKVFFKPFQEGARKALSDLQRAKTADELMSLIKKNKTFTPNFKNVDGTVDTQTNQQRNEQFQNLYTLVEGVVDWMNDAANASRFAQSLYVMFDEGNEGTITSMFTGLGSTIGVKVKDDPDSGKRTAKNLGRAGLFLRYKTDKDGDIILDDAGNAELVFDEKIATAAALSLIQVLNDAFYRRMLLTDEQVEEQLDNLGISMEEFNSWSTYDQMAFRSHIPTSVLLDSFRRYFKAFTGLDPRSNVALSYDGNALIDALGVQALTYAQYMGWLTREQHVVTNSYYDEETDTLKTSNEIYLALNKISDDIIEAHKNDYSALSQYSKNDTIGGANDFLLGGYYRDAILDCFAPADGVADVYYPGDVLPEPTEKLHTYTKYTEAQIAAIKAMQETKYYVNTGFLSLVQKLDISGILDLFGVNYDFDNESIQQLFNKTDLASVSGKQQSLLASWQTNMDRLQKLDEIRQAQGIKDLSDAYLRYNYQATASGRFQEMSPTASQADKFARQLFSQVKCWVYKNSMKHQDQVTHYGFKLAVLQGLGVKLTKQKDEAAIDQLFDQVLAICESHKGWTQESDQDTLIREIKAMQAELAAQDFDANSFLGLSVLENMDRYISSDTGFRCTIYLEHDGSTNGFVNAVFKFASGFGFTDDELKVLFRGGIFVGVPLTQYDYKQLDGTDNYQGVADEAPHFLNRQLNALRKQVEGFSKKFRNKKAKPSQAYSASMLFYQIAATINKVFKANGLTSAFSGDFSVTDTSNDSGNVSLVWKIARAIVKTPVTAVNYGQGLLSNAKSLFNNIIETPFIKSLSYAIQNGIEYTTTVDEDGNEIQVESANATPGRAFFCKAIKEGTMKPEEADAEFQKIVQSLDDMYLYKFVIGDAGRVLRVPYWYSKRECQVLAESVTPVITEQFEDGLLVGFTISEGTSRKKESYSIYDSDGKVDKSKFREMITAYKKYKPIAYQLLYAQKEITEEKDSDGTIYYIREALSIQERFTNFSFNVEGKSIAIRSFRYMFADSVYKAVHQNRGENVDRSLRQITTITNLMSIVARVLERRFIRAVMEATGSAPSQEDMRAFRRQFRWLYPVYGGEEASNITDLGVTQQVSFDSSELGGLGVSSESALSTRPFYLAPGYEDSEIMEYIDGQGRTRKITSTFYSSPSVRMAGEPGVRSLAVMVQALGDGAMQTYFFSHKKYFLEKYKDRGLTEEIFNQIANRYDGIEGSPELQPVIADMINEAAAGVLSENPMRGMRNMWDAFINGFKTKDGKRVGGIMSLDMQTRIEIINEISSNKFFDRNNQDEMAAIDMLHQGDIPFNPDTVIDLIAEFGITDHADLTKIDGAIRDKFRHMDADDIARYKPLLTRLDEAVKQVDIKHKVLKAIGMYVCHMSVNKFGHMVGKFILNLHLDEIKTLDELLSKIRPAVNSLFRKFMKEEGTNTDVEVPTNEEPQAEVDLELNVTPAPSSNPPTEINREASTASNTPTPIRSPLAEQMANYGVIPSGSEVLPKNQQGKERLVSDKRRWDLFFINVLKKAANAIKSKGDVWFETFIKKNLTNDTIVFVGSPTEFVDRYSNVLQEIGVYSTQDPVFSTSNAFVFRSSIDHKQYIFVNNIENNGNRILSSLGDVRDFISRTRRGLIEIARTNVRDHWMSYDKNSFATDSKIWPRLKTSEDRNKAIELRTKYRDANAKAMELRAERDSIQNQIDTIKESSRQAGTTPDSAKIEELTARYNKLSSQLDDQRFAMEEAFNEAVDLFYPPEVIWQIAKKLTKENIESGHTELGAGIRRSYKHELVHAATTLRFRYLAETPLNKLKKKEEVAAKYAYDELCELFDSFMDQDWITHSELTEEQQLALAQFQRQIQSYEADGSSRTTLICEFAAFALSNPEYINALKAAKVSFTRNRLTAIKNIYEAIKKAFRTILGLSNKEVDDFLETYYGRLQLNTSVIVEGVSQETLDERAGISSSKTNGEAALTTVLNMSNSSKPTAVYFEKNDTFRNNLSKRVEEFKSILADRGILEFTDVVSDPLSPYMGEAEFMAKYKDFDQIITQLSALGVFASPEEKQAARFIFPAYALVLGLDKTENYRRAENLRQAVLSKVSIKDFQTDSNDYIGETIYNALTNLNNYKDSEGNSLALPIFMTMAFVSPMIRDVMSRVSITANDRHINGWSSLNNGKTNFDDVIYDLTESLCNSVSDALNDDTRQSTALEAVDYYVRDLAKQQAKWNAMTISSTLLTAGETFTKGVINTAARYLTGNTFYNSVLKSGSLLAAPIKLAHGIASMVFSEDSADINFDIHRKAARWASKVDDIYGPRKFFSNIVLELTKELLHSDKYSDLVQYYEKKAKSTIQQGREDFRAQVPRIIENKFREEGYKLTKQNRKAINTGVLKCDLGALLNQHDSTDFIDYILKGDGRRLDDQRRSYENKLHNLGISNKVLDDILLESQQLADHMVKGTTGVGLLRNAKAIAEVYTAYLPRVNTEKVASLLDRYISILALKNLSTEDFQELKKAWAQAPKAMTYVIQTQASLARQETKIMESASNAVDRNMTKGYYPKTTTGGGALLAVSKENLSYYEKLGYRYIKDTAIDSSLCYVAADVNPQAGYTQGALQTILHSAGGVDLQHGYTRAPIIKRVFHKNTDTVLKMVDSSDGWEACVPVYNKDGWVFAYDVYMDSRLVESVYRYEQDFAKNLGAWAGRQFEEDAAESLNTALITSLGEAYQIDLKYNSAEGYVNVFAIKNPIIKDAVNHLSPTTLDTIEKTFGEGCFYVRRDMLDDIIGHRKASVVDMWTGSTNWSPKTQQVFIELAELFLGKNACAKLLKAEKFAQNLSALARNRIVIASGTVLAANLIGNFKQLMVAGVSLRDLRANVPSMLRECTQYNRDRARIADLEVQRKIAQNLESKDPLKVKKLTAQIDAIKTSWQKFSIAPVLNAGEYTTIADIGDVGGDLLLSMGSAGKFFQQLWDDTPQPIKDIMGTTLIFKNTAIYKGLQKATQYGDFISKAILYNHLTKNRHYSSEEALTRVRYEFVNYDMIAGRSREYIENLGLIWFYNYKMRSVRTAISMLKDNPAKALIMNTVSGFLPACLNAGTPLTDNVFSSFITGKLGYSIGPGMATGIVSQNLYVNLFL